jgi:hypothetical protein
VASAFEGDSHLRHQLASTWQVAEYDRRVQDHVPSYEQPSDSIYTRRGYDFRIEIRFLPYPYADFRYWAKVMGVVPQGATASDSSTQPPPFVPVACHGSTAQEAIDQVRRQIDDWLDAHREVGRVERTQNPPV